MTRVAYSHQTRDAGMAVVEDFCQFLDGFAPVHLAEDWDNVGLLLGDRRQPVARVMTCLTVTPASVAEAVEGSASLIVTHHPLPFRPLKRITTDSVPGRLVLELLTHRIAVYSPHTCFDSAAEGINAQLAKGLGLARVDPLLPRATDAHGLGSGRFGDLAERTTVADFAQQVMRFLRIDGAHTVGSADATVQRVAVACGSAGEFLRPALQAGCELLVTGETSFHTCLEAEAEGMALVLPGHYASERFALEFLAERLTAEFPEIDVWASAKESDPLQWRSSSGS